MTRIRKRQPKRAVAANLDQPTRRTPYSSESTGARRRTLALPEKFFSLLDTEASLRRRARNVVALAHRANTLPALQAALHAEFGAEGSQAPCVRRAVRDALKTLQRTPRGLRVRSLAAHAKTLPPVGLLQKLMTAALKVYHIPETHVLNARFRRIHNRWTVCVTVQGEPQPREADGFLSNPRPAYAEDIGLAVTPEGITVSRRTVRGAVVKGYRNIDGNWPTLRRVSADNFRPAQAHHYPTHHLIPMDLVLDKDFADNLWAVLTVRTPRSISFERSMAPNSPRKLVSAFKQLVSDFRKRSAVSAIAFKECSSLGEENQKTHSYWRSTGLFDGRTLRPLLSEALVECPHCGSWTTLRVNSHTGAPLQTRTRCTCCTRSLRVGEILADRARSRGTHAWEQNSVPPRVVSQAPDAFRGAKHKAGRACAGEKSTCQVEGTRPVGGAHTAKRPQATSRRPSEVAQPAKGKRRATSLRPMVPGHLSPRPRQGHDVPAMHTRNGLVSTASVKTAKPISLPNQPTLADLAAYSHLRLARLAL